MHKGDAAEESHIDLVEPILRNIGALLVRFKELSLVQPRAVGLDDDKILGQVPAIPFDIGIHEGIDILLVQLANSLLVICSSTGHYFLLSPSVKAFEVFSPRPTFIVGSVPVSVNAPI